MQARLRLYFKYFLVLSGFMLAAIIIDFGYRAQGGDGFLQVVVLDVGQGSAAYVVDPSGYELVIDTGRNMQGIRGLWQYRSIFDREIDEVIISHADADHMSMLPYLVRNFDIGHISWSPYEFQGDVYEAVAQSLLETQQDTRTIYAPKTLQPGADLALDILWPPVEYEGSGRNNHSVVVRLRYQDADILFPGDIEQAVEEDLVARYGDSLAAEVLVLPHHGSKSSSSYQFLEAVDPQLVIISAGEDNPYGHPHAEVLERLQELEIPVLNTAVVGDVVLRSDGEEIVVQ